MSIVLRPVREAREKFESERSLKSGVDYRQIFSVLRRDRGLHCRSVYNASVGCGPAKAATATYAGANLFRLRQNQPLLRTSMTAPVSRNTVYHAVVTQLATHSPCFCDKTDRNH
jgi:hypothetical protein